MIKLVIFDLDGTLLNTIDDLGNSCNYILEKYNFPVHPLESYRYFVGNGVSKLIERALPEAERNPGFIEELRKEFIEYYSKHSEDRTHPYPGVIEMLKELRSGGVKLAVASNKFISGTQALVQKYFGEIQFVSVLGQRENIAVKPDPQIVYDTMKESGIQDKNEILYVGDTGTDMKTAVNSGIKGIGVLWGFRPKEELEETGAVYLVEKAEEIVRIVKDNS
ncbi:MAG: HAD family hydrolase [Flavobacteriaceae bacterium]|jgi:phosphoglycolate phosphatase|nr:HAD family hydrolase [Flavobacteriaceae bacterium]